jgi:hypothetical protein
LMETLHVVDGKVMIPERFELSKENRRLHIKMPWMTQVERLCKDDWTVSSQMWFRCKADGDKPYVPEGTIELNGERFKVEGRKAANH